MSFMEQGLVKNYKAVAKTFKRYWEVYGGYRSLMCSPYFHLSLVMFALTWPFLGGRTDVEWYGLVIEISPDLLGFSLGGYAILLAFGNDDFLCALSGDDADGPSPFMKMNVAFVNFIIFQVVALVSAVLSMVWEASTGPIAWFGYLVFLYSLLLAMAAVIAVFQLSDWFNTFNEDNEE